MRVFQFLGVRSVGWLRMQGLCCKCFWSVLLVGGRFLAVPDHARPDRESGVAEPSLHICLC